MEFSPEIPLSLPRRPRRLRQSAATREMVRETRLHPADLIQPLFVVDADRAREEIPSLPGQFRLGREDFLAELERLEGLGIRGVAVFPRVDPARKSRTGREAALDPGGLVPSLAREARRRGVGINLIADLALDPYTEHGHDGVVDPESGRVLNDETVAILVEMALCYAEAGIDWVAPSDMMDGRVGAIRQGLDAAGFEDTVILAYSAKFASAFYGPFRDAVGSKSGRGPGVDKSTYQVSPANAREALLEVDLDCEEGADLVMVKPAGPYLDILARVRERCGIPVAAYQVSGEYACLHAAARAGWLEYEAVRDESLLAIRRAGADLILTYFAAEVAGRMAS